MRSPQLSSEQAIEEAVAFLRTGPHAPEEWKLRSLIKQVVATAIKEEHWHKLTLEHREAMESIQKTAREMLKGLRELKELAPWVSDQETMRLSLMYDVLPVENPNQLEADLQSLSTMGAINEKSHYRGTRLWVVKSGPFAERLVRLQLPAKKPTRPRLPEYILNLHQTAITKLKGCGMTPSLGTGGNVAKLGALLCTAAGFPLKQGESTKAARLARYHGERLAYTKGGKTVKRVIDEKGTTCTQTTGPYEPMWTECEILADLQSHTLSNLG